MAVVAAEDADAAAAAAELVRVEYQEIEPVIGVRSALEPGARSVHADPSVYAGRAAELDHPNLQSRDLQEAGDLDAAFASAGFILDERFTTAAVHQAHLEPHGVVVSYDGSGFEIWTSNKTPYILRKDLASLFGKQLEEVRIHFSGIGGDFGAKAFLMDEALACALAMRTGRPVRLVMSAVEEFTASNPRHASEVHCRLAVGSDGRLLALDVKSLFDGGAYASFKPIPYLPAARTAGAPYRWRAIRLDASCVYTNTTPRGYMRGPGAPQTLFAVESLIDEAARRLETDPLEFRLANAVAEGDRSALGEPWRGVYLRPLLEGAAEYAKTIEKRPHIGVGVGCTEKYVGAGISGAYLDLQPDGRVWIRAGLPDNGTGARTIVHQIVSQELGRDPETIEFRIETTSDAPFDSGSGASRVTHVAGKAARAAAIELKQNLIELAAELWECPPELLAWDGDAVRLPEGPDRRIGFDELAAEACRRAGGSVRMENLVEAGIPEETTFAVQVAEVAVDPDTGRVEVQRLTSFNDLGRCINPLQVESQIQGGTIQALGMALSEEIVMDGGIVTNSSLADYKIPAMLDCPSFGTAIYEGAEGPEPFGAKAVGEICAVPGVAAIANAVRDATGFRATALPIDPATIRDGLRKSATGNNAEMTGDPAG